MRYLFLVFILLSPFVRAADVVSAYVPTDKYDVYCTPPYTGARSQLVAAAIPLSSVQSSISSWIPSLSSYYPQSSFVSMPSFTVGSGFNVLFNYYSSALQRTTQAYSSCLVRVTTSYACPPSSNPDYTILSDSSGNPSSTGQYCAKPSICQQQKGNMISAYVNSPVAGDTICYHNCVATNPAALDTTHWVYHMNYTYNGQGCDSDFGWMYDDNAVAANGAQDQKVNAQTTSDKAQSDATSAGDSATAAATAAQSASQAATAAQAAADAAQSAADAAKNQSNAAAQKLVTVISNPASTQAQVSAAQSAAKAAADAAAAAATTAAQALAQAQAVAAQAQAATGHSSDATTAANAAAAAAAQALAQAQAAAAQAQATYNAAVAAGVKASAEALAAANQAAAAANQAATAAANAANAATAASNSANAAAAAAAAAGSGAGAGGSGGNAGSGGSSGGGGNTASGGTTTGGTTGDEEEGDGFGDYSKPGDSKDYLKDIFSADSIADLKQKQTDLQDKIKSKSNEVKGLFSFSDISMSGSLQSDVHNMRGVDVDLSGQKVFQGLSGIRAVFWLIAVLIGIGIILNRSGSN